MTIGEKQLIEEMSAPVKNNPWEVVDLPIGKKEGGLQMGVYHKV